MDLILWRHAEAEDAQGNDDLGRALTPRGRKQAARMAAWLKAKLPAKTRILVSPAVRCQQTAAALERRVITVDSIAPDASAEAVLRAAAWPDAGGAVLVVGHQPTLGQTAAKLMDEGNEPWRLRKGAVCWLRSNPDDAVVVVHARKTPDEL